MRKKGSTKDSKLSDVLIPDRESLGIPSFIKSEKDFYLVRRWQRTLEKNHEISRNQDEHELRKKYLLYVFLFVVIFVVLVLVLVSIAGCKCIPFYLSDAVLITLLTTTTANVIGILFIAFNWLFPSRKKDDQAQKG
jgi:hypothetical protein